MKSFACAILVAQAVFQITNAQCLRSAFGPLINSCASPIISPCSGQVIGPCSSPGLNPCGCGGPCSSYAAPVIPAPAIIQSNSVAASLADTLSLLTVSSLLADTLPVVSSGCGCGGLGSCGCGGYGGYGSYYY